MDACKMLKEYARYVEQVRMYARLMPFAEAVEKAVDHCIQTGSLAEFLSTNRAEAIKVSIYEYDEELHFKTLYEEGREAGHEEGLEEKNRTIIRNMLARSMTDEDILAIAECRQEQIDQVRKDTISTRNE